MGEQERSDPEQDHQIAAQLLARAFEHQTPGQTPATVLVNNIRWMATALVMATNSRQNTAQYLRALAEDLHPVGEIDIEGTLDRFFKTS